jgi:spore coat protein A
MKLTRREILKAGLAGCVGLALPWKFKVLKAHAVPFPFPALSDPALQPKFVNPVPDALAPGFKYAPVGMRGGTLYYEVGVGQNIGHMTGLVDDDGDQVATPIWGYGQNNQYTWPGMTFEVQSGIPTQVQWQNNLFDVHEHLLPVDTSLHWCYSLHGYEDRTIGDDGVPIVTHLHGGHTRYLFDGNPEQFFSPGWKVRGPRFRGRTAIYENDQWAGNLWYHDHALGITRLNVYAGLAGFYFIRDDVDTGKTDNPLGLPAWPYEKAYAIQDRMFRGTGELFYPAFPDEPFYDDFITGEGVTLPSDIFPDGGPTALAEFFGDHMVVNGLIWPKENVEPRNYRLHVLNGTDSRFMALRFRAVPLGASDLSSAGNPLPFWVIGSDQGLASSATMTETLVSEPGSRYDIVFNFGQDDNALVNKRIIMENVGGDSPFGGDLFADLTAAEIAAAVEAGDLFPERQTDRIMAFDVIEPLDTEVPDNFDDSAIGQFGGNTNAVTRTRKVALFEGTDEFGRLQPLLGTAEPASDFLGRPIINPYTDDPFEGAIAWHSPTTENPALNATEIWEIYNATGDAHPVHLHLVHFEVLDRWEFTANVIEQDVVQHNGETGVGFRLENIVVESEFVPGAGYVENAPKDMVTALPSQSGNTGQMTRIKVTFDKSGRYVWHCHILSHEDHEMMRVLHVGGEF